MGLFQEKIGASTEKRLLEMLRKRGFWALFIPSAMGGQPFDIVAAKDNLIYVLEVKNVKKGKRFPLSRVEDNQWTSMEYVYKFAHCKNIGIAIYWNADEYVSVMPYRKLLAISKNGDKSFGLSDCVDFDEWLKGGTDESNNRRRNKNKPAIS